MYVKSENTFVLIAPWFLAQLNMQRRDVLMKPFTELQM